MIRLILVGVLLFLLECPASAIEQGQWITLTKFDYYPEVVQIIDKNRMLVKVTWYPGANGGASVGKTDEIVLMQGDTRGMVDGATDFWLGETMLVDGTYQYKTATGSNTVRVMKRLTPAEQAAALAKQKAEAEAHLTREWTDSTGKHKFVGKFLGFKGSQVLLERPESQKKIEVPMLDLSKADQEWVRAELKARADKAKNAKKPKK